MAAFSSEQWAALAVLGLTLFGVSFGRLPGLALERSGVALLGAALLIGTGVLEPAEAWALIHGEIILLLLSLMVINAVLTRSGFFSLMTAHAVRGARSTLALVTALVFASGVLSALFLNDTVVLMLTPLVLAVTRSLGRPALPYLLALAMSANIGSAAALTGNPQNLIVGLRGDIGFAPFLLALAPPALLGLGALVLLLVLAYPREFRRVPLARSETLATPTRPLLLRFASLAVLGMLAAFALGVNVTAAALVTAALLLVAARAPSDALLGEVDWNLLVLFAGLFVVVGALEHTGLSNLLFGALEPLLEAGVLALAGFTTLLSTLLSNVPAVLLLATALEGLGGSARDWLTVALASTLAGNLTLIASVANLIVVESARRQGVGVGFFAHLRLGVPVTLVTLLIGVLWLGYGPGA